MSTRFHDKWHAANHFSVSANGIPDAGRDPVASYKFPFEGEFIMNNSPRNGGHGGYDEQTIENEWILSSNRIDTNTIRSQQDDRDAQITLSARDGESRAFVTIELKKGNETDERTGYQKEHTVGYKEESVDSYRKFTVGGYNESTIVGDNTLNNKSDFTETTTGNHVEDVTGTNTVTITGKNTFNNKNDFEETTTGNHVETVNGTNDVTVVGDNTFTNKANLIEGTSGNYTETIAGERTEHTVKSSHRTVGATPKQYSEDIYFSSGKYEETVNGVRDETTNGDSKSTVNGNRTEKTTGNATYVTTGNEIRNTEGFADVNIDGIATVNTGAGKSIYLNDSTSVASNGSVFTEELTVSSNDGYNPWYEHGSIHLHNGMTESPRISAIRVDSTSAFIDYLSAASADIHQVDIQIYELSGYDISGTDTARVPPQVLPKGSRMWFVDTGVWVDSWFKLNGDETISGNSNVGRNLTVGEDITGKGNFHLSGYSEVLGDSLVSGNENVHGGITGESDLYISGNSTIRENSTVSGTETVWGDETIKSNLAVSGDEEIGGDVSVLGSQNIVGNLVVETDVSVSGSQEISGNESVYGNLNVSGNEEIKGNQTISGNSEILGDESLSGSIDVRGDANVGGLIYQDTGVVVGKNASISLDIEHGIEFPIKLLVRGFGNSYSGIITINEDLSIESSEPAQSPLGAHTYSVSDFRQTDNVLVVFYDNGARHISCCSINVVTKELYCYSPWDSVEFYNKEQMSHHTIAIGEKATVENNPGAITIGYESSALPAFELVDENIRGGVAIGQFASVNGNGITIGNNSHSYNGGISIGNDTMATSGFVVIGDNHTDLVGFSVFNTTVINNGKVPNSLLSPFAGNDTWVFPTIQANAILFNSGIKIGNGAINNGDGMAIGNNSLSIGGIAIGDGSSATTSKAVQIGRGVNNNIDSLRIFDYELLDNGKIPEERLSILVEGDDADGLAVRDAATHYYLNHPTTVAGKLIVENLDGTVGTVSAVAASAECLIDGGDVVNANTVTNADEVSNAVSALTVEYVGTTQEVSIAGRVLNATEVVTTDKLHADRVQEAEIVESAAQVTSAGSVGVAEYVEADTHIVNVETAETVETALNVVNVTNPIQNAGRVVEAETVGTATSVERTENITSAFGSIQYVDTVENAISAGEVTTVLSASYIGWVDDVENAGTATTVTSAASVDYADAAATIHSAESVISANHIEAMASADEVETVISADYVTEVQNADIVRSANTVMSIGGSVTMDESGISANRVSETDAVGFIEANGDIVVPHYDLMRDKYIIVAETESETANVEIATGTMKSYSLDMILDFGSSSRKIDISLNGVKDSEHGIIKWIGTSPIASEAKSLFCIRIVGVGEKVYGMEIGTGGTDYTRLVQGLLESQGSGSTVDGYRYPETPEEKKVKSIPQDISKSVDILRGNAFPQFRFLETIDFPNCKVVWANAFSGCTSLTDVNLPECVSLAGASTFDSCSSLVSVNIPKVKTLRSKTFFGCHSLEYVALDSCETFTIPFSDSRPQTMQAENLTSLTLPSIKTISSKAFGYSASQQYTGIQNLYIPNKTMQEIKDMANYATWYLSETCVIHASDGDFTYGA